MLKVIGALRLETDKPETTNHKRGETRTLKNSKELRTMILLFKVYSLLYYLLS